MLASNTRVAGVTEIKLGFELEIPEIVTVVPAGGLEFNWMEKICDPPFSEIVFPVLGVRRIPLVSSSVLVMEGKLGPAIPL